MNKIRKGDSIIVIAGKDKGRRGNVGEVLKNGKLIVPGINVAKKNVKPNPNAGIEGGIVDKDMAIHASNVMVVNPETDKGERIGFKVEGDKKIRIFKSNGATVEQV